MTHSWFILSVYYFSGCVMLCGCWWFWTCWWNIWNGQFSFHSTVIKVFCWFWGELFEEKAQFGTSVPPRHCLEHLTWLLGVFPTISDPDLNWFTGLLTPYEPTSSPETSGVSSLAVPKSRSKTRCERAFGTEVEPNTMQSVSKKASFFFFFLEVLT